MVKTQTKLSQTLVLAYTRLSLEGREGRLWSTAKEEVRADKLDSGGKGGEGGVEEGRHQERDGVGEGRRGGVVGALGWAISWVWRHVVSRYTSEERKGEG